MMTKDSKPKPLNRFERYVAELTWGGIPCDIEWVRNSHLFKQKYNEIIEQETSLTKLMYK